MPTSFTGLLLFVVLLLPGLAYQVGKERFGAERRPPAFRETVAVVAASVISELLVLVLTWPLWAWSLNVHRFVREPGKYWKAHPGLIASWVLGLLLVACALAFAATLPKVRDWKISQKVLGRYPHESTLSAWWRLFEEAAPGVPAERRHVGCILEDGSYIAGRLGSFNRSADDLGDRDLILLHPIEYRAKGSTNVVAYPAGAACISARRIAVMFVSYLNPPRP